MSPILSVPPATLPLQHCPPSTLVPSLSHCSLLTDLYQLTMAACYCGEGLEQRPARFELFVRTLPPDFGYLVAMGLSQVLDYIQSFSFSSAQIAALQDTGIFGHAPDRFWNLLAQGRFTGDLWAVPEGTLIFANEPILRVDAPLWQAQLIETYLLNTINYQTLIATRAARIRDVAGADALLLEFGTRRAFSPQASLWAARAALAAGFDATSNVMAALELGETPSGTMAHALVMALTAMAGDEDQAFTAFHRYFPGAALLIDTYDTVAAADRLAQQVQTGAEIPAVRLDSGDLVSLSQAVVDRLPDTQVFASGDLDEYEVQRLRAAGAPITGYGLGTKLVTGTPVNGVYKLVDMDGVPVMKEAAAKITYPGCKQVFRTVDQGQFRGDRLGLMTDCPQPGEYPLLQPMVQAGERLYGPEPLATIAQRTQAQVALLPDPLRRITAPAPAPVVLSTALEALTQATRRSSAKNTAKNTV